MSESPELNPSRWLHEHGDILYRFALGRVRNPQVAEDLLQDTFLAAIKGADGFSGRSAERTWLVGILKHKIIDYYRKNNREIAAESPGDQMSDPEASLDRKGRWKVGQAEWITNPEKAYEREEFWQTLNQCLSKLNEKQRQVFELRELEHLNAEEICERMDISSSNLWVLLHRARLQLKDCLQINWVDRDQKHG